LINEKKLEVPTPQFPTIQSAANAAQPGDTIFVGPGTYRESVTLPKGVSLISKQGAASTVIDAGGYAHGVDGGELVRGFTITNATWAGIGRGDIGSGNTTKQIINNIIIGNHQGGIDLYGTSVKILNNVIAKNSTTEYGGGIRLDSCRNSEIRNNAIVDNSASDGGGLYFSYVSSTTAFNNILVGNSGYYGAAIRIWPECNDAYQPAITYNDVWSNPVTSSIGREVYMCGELDPSNLTKDPQFVDRPVGDYHLTPGSPAINVGHPDPIYNDLDGSRNDIGAYGGPPGGW
jgi:hypothetical protein